MGGRRRKIRNRQKPSRPTTTPPPPPPPPPCDTAAAANHPPLDRRITDLPDGTLTDILSRLPAQSVALCRCVCKLFLNLTTPNPNFARLHFSRSQSHNYPPQLLIRTSGRHGVHSEHLHLLDPQLKGEPVHVKPGFLLPKPRKQQPGDRYRYYSVVNSCNGLLCLSKIGGDPRVVYNPITAEYVKLPKWKSGDLFGKPSTEIVRVSFESGFGHCSETNKFKVLRTMAWLGVADINELGTDSWRRIESEAPAAIGHGRDPTFLNGILYWCCGKNGIVSFDFRTEMFGEVQLPNHFEERHKKAMKISVLGDCLSVSDVIPYDEIHIWTMKQDDVQESWTKQFVVDTKKLFFFGTPEFQPFYMSSGKLLMLDGSEQTLVCYDFLDKSFRFLKFDGDVAPLMVYLHTPRFASLKDAVAAEHVKVLDCCSRSDPGEDALFLKQHHSWLFIDDALLRKLAPWRGFIEQML